MSDTDEQEGRPLHPDNLPYWRFTGPQRLDKVLHTLEGILKGIAADRQITAEEVRAVRSWMKEQAAYSRYHPFNEFMPFLDKILADGVIDAEERADVLWLCDRLAAPNEYFAAVTSDMQRLHGMVGGIAADGKITEDELHVLSGWMDEHEQLKGCWPYDELESILLAVQADGKIDETEHEQLLAFFSDFVDFGQHRVADLSIKELAAPIKGCCAVCPEVSFKGSTFCVTGSSTRGTRRELAALIEGLGGRVSSSVTKNTDYLVVGADGNPAWAFACYGRKVEQAMTYRKQGCPITLVHEHDFWDAFEDARK